MGKVLSILIGLILIALGVWAILAGPTWRSAVLVFLQGAAVIMAFVVGLITLVFGLSELRAGAEEPPVIESGRAASPDQPSRPS
jgi:hypothetical protein